MTRVLIVDDKPDNRYYLESLLGGHGYEVESARHGAEALVRARSAPPDLVISDLLMPVMDGYTLLRHWKADSRLSQVPFVVYTATYTEPEDERLALSLGADAFVLKPAEPDAFLARLEAIEAATDLDGTSVPQTLDQEPDLLKIYSQTLVRKLEEKTLQLEQTNKALEEAIAERRRIAAEQRELTTRLEAERSRLAEAQAVAKLGSWETDLTTGAVLWSEQTHRIFETDPAQFSPTHARFLERVHPGDRDAVDQAFTQSLTTGGDHAIDYRIAMVDGRVKFLQERWLVVRDAQGVARRAVGTCQDITAQKLAEETLRESEERFRQLAETISEVFWVTNPEKTEILYISPAYETIWGRSREDLYAHPETWLDAIHQDDRKLILLTLPKQGTGEYDVSYRVVRPDGSVRWVRDRAFPVRDAQGGVYRVVGIAEDITERKAIEAQFLRAQRLESIGTLAGGIAHDLNNVLTPILMSIELLKADESPEGRLRTINAIESSARKGAAMVQQVLSFARGVEGNRAEVDIAGLVHDVARIAEDTFLKSIAVTSDVPDDLPAVLGDSTQLHQVLLNLCVNARDAMPEGGAIALSARAILLDEAAAAAHPGLDAGPYVVVEVADTGGGMTPGVLGRIFDPFFTTKAPGKGTGLGLPTSLAIVKSHGGLIDVTSQPGAGSRFLVYLPVGQATSRDAIVPATGAIPRGDGQLILVVDDEQRIREISGRMLEMFGYRVLLASDGAEAVALYTRERANISVVLTDMMMPVMDGAATIRAIRGLDPGARIVAVSGLAAGPDLPLEARTGHGVRQLPKPYTADALLRAIAASLGEPS